MPREMRHTAGGRCRRQVWRRETSRGAEDASGGGRRIGRRKMHWKAEDALEGGGGVGRRRRRKQSSRWKGVAEGGSPYSSLIPHNHITSVHRLPTVPTACPRPP